MIADGTESRARDGQRYNPAANALICPSGEVERRFTPSPIVPLMIAAAMIRSRPPMKLLSSPLSPFAARVRLAIYAGSLPVELAPANLWLPTGQRLRRRG